MRTKPIRICPFGKATIEFRPRKRYPYWEAFIRQPGKKQYWSNEFVIDYLNNNTLRYINNQPVRSIGQYLTVRALNPMYPSRNMSYRGFKIYHAARALQNMGLARIVPGVCSKTDSKFIWSITDLDMLVDLLQSDPTTEEIDDTEERNRTYSLSWNVIEERGCVTIIWKHSGTTAIVTEECVDWAAVSSYAIAYLDESSEMYYEKNEKPYTVSTWLAKRLRGKQKNYADKYKRTIINHLLMFFPLRDFVATVESACKSSAYVWNERCYKLEYKPLVDTPVISIPYLKKQDLLDEFVAKVKECELTSTEEVAK